jgi:photosystem II stability/assembly factor-like uncharacterized protein
LFPKQWPVKVFAKVDHLGRRAVLLTAAALFLGSPASSAPIVPPALGRPAITVRSPERTVLLAAVSAGSRLVAVGEHGVVVLSDDGGKSWRQARAVPTSVSLTAIRFADPLNGWAVGHAGVILHTTDGGETWTKQADGQSLAQTALAGAMRGGEASQIKAAQQLLDDGPDKPLLDVLVFGASRALVVGAYGLAYETTDGGATWNTLMDRMENPKGLHLNVIRGDGSAIYIAGEQGLLLRSDDNGSSFHGLQSPYAGSWFSLVTRQKGSLIVAGLRGNAFSSIDKGVTWTRLEGAAPASFVSAVVTGNGRVVLANQAGQLVGIDAGGRLQTLQIPPLPPSSGLVSLPSGELLVMGMTGAMRVPVPSDFAGAER